MSRNDDLKVIMRLFCREIRSNEVLNWSSSNSIVTFMPNRSYIFDPETSCAGCDDKKDTFVTVNIPLLVRSQTDYSVACTSVQLGRNQDNAD